MDGGGRLSAETIECLDGAGAGLLEHIAGGDDDRVRGSVAFHDLDRVVERRQKGVGVYCIHAAS